MNSYIEDFIGSENILPSPIPNRYPNRYPATTPSKSKSNVTIQSQLGMRRDDGTPFRSPMPLLPTTPTRPSRVSMLSGPIPYQNSPSLLSTSLLNDLQYSGSNLQSANNYMTRNLADLTPYHKRFPHNNHNMPIIDNLFDFDQDEVDEQDESELKNKKKQNKKRKKSESLSSKNTKKKKKAKKQRKQPIAIETKAKKIEKAKEKERLEELQKKKKLKRIVKQTSNNNNTETIGLVRSMLAIPYSHDNRNEYPILANNPAFGDLVLNKNKFSQGLSNYSCRCGSIGQAGAIKICKSAHGRLKDLEFTPKVQKKYMETKVRQKSADALSKEFRERKKEKHQKRGINDDEDFDTTLFTIGLTGHDVIFTLIQNYCQFTSMMKISRNMGTFIEYAKEVYPDCDLTHKLFSNLKLFINLFENMETEIPQDKKPSGYIEEDGYKAIPYMKNLHNNVNNNDDDE